MPAATAPAPVTDTPAKVLDTRTIQMAPSPTLPGSVTLPKNVAAPNDTTTRGNVSLAAPATEQQLRAYADAAIASRTAQQFVSTTAEVRDATATDSGRSGPIKAVINTATVDRYSSIVDPRGAVIDNYLRNPVLLWGHGMDWQTGTVPVGRTLTLDVSDSEISVEVEFDTEQEIGRTLDRMYRQKWLRGFSIGFIPISYAIEQIDGKQIIRYTKWELCELSAVSVPGNPEGLARSLVAGEVLPMDENQRDTLVAAFRAFDPKFDKSLETASAEHQAAVVAASKSFVARGTSLASTVGTATATFQRSSAPPTPVVFHQASGVQQPSDQATRSLVPPQADPVSLDLGTLTIDQVRGLIAGANAQARNAAEVSSLESLGLDKFNLEAEATAANEADVTGLFAARRGDELLYGHHRANGTVSESGLFACMGRLLTEGADDTLTAEDRDVIYDHLASHYRELGLDVPDAGIYTRAETFGLALNGEIAYIDEHDDAYRFVEVVGNDAGFVRVADGQMALFPIPSEYRKGAEFSQANRDRLDGLAETLETMAKDLNGFVRNVRKVAAQVRLMIANDNGDGDRSVVPVGASSPTPASNVVTDARVLEIAKALAPLLK
jgi:phage head maturation protease